MFMAGGLLLTVLYIANVILSPKNIDRKRSTGGIIRSSVLALFLTGGYGAGLVWFLKHKLKALVLQHWEFCLAYLGLFCVLGLVGVRLPARE